MEPISSITDYGFVIMVLLLASSRYLSLVKEVFPDAASRERNRPIPIRRAINQAGMKRTRNADVQREEEEDVLN